MNHSEFRTNLDNLADWCLTQDADGIIQHSYDKYDLANMSAVLIHIAGSLAFDFYKRNELPFDQMCSKHGEFGKAIRQMFIDHTGLDVADTYDDPLESEIVRD